MATSFLWNSFILIIFVELYQRNIPAKFYQNRPPGFRGEDLLLTDRRTDGWTTDSAPS